jgi:hypothetical protein
MLLSVQGGVPAGVAGAPGSPGTAKSGRGDFAAVLEGEIANQPGAGASGIAPPVGGHNGGTADIAPPVGGGNTATVPPDGSSEIGTPVGTPTNPSGMSTMQGSFAGDASMLADMVPIAESGTLDAIEPQNVDPNGPPVVSDLGDAAALTAMHNAATTFASINAMLLLTQGI